MEHVELDRMLDSRKFLDRLYSFAYSRCGSSYEAEDLCSDILML
ncbi:MAG TPA: sigma factor [Clostridiales bacterium]|nr:sigma factor [Clostridiales bacterium]HPV01907.1 sigma factor [Clostridiales bacterium]